MFKNSADPEVLISGAGPVGLFCALLLTKLGVRVRIVDTGIWTCSHSYALALHGRSVELLKETGVAEAALQNAYTVRRIGLYDNKSPLAYFDLENYGGTSAALAVLRQDALEGLLEKSLNRLGVNVDWRHELDALQDAGGHVRAVIHRYEAESRGYVVAHNEWVIAKTDSVDVPFVIGADGYNSSVRRALRFPFPEAGPALYYAVFEFKSDADLQGEMRLAIGDGTADVLWPLPGGFCRWSFQLVDYQDPEVDRLKEYRETYGVPSDRVKQRTAGTEWTAPVLGEENLRQLIAARAPWFTGSIDEITWRTVVRFERRLSTGFGKGRLWLAGDSAHLTGPGGVQSVNAGLAEAYDLCHAIKRILRGEASAAELEAYESRWTERWRKLLALDGSVRSENGADPRIGRNAAQLISCLPAYGPELTALARQLHIAA